MEYRIQLIGLFINVIRINYLRNRLLASLAAAHISIKAKFTFRIRQLLVLVLIKGFGLFFNYRNKFTSIWKKKY